MESEEREPLIIPHTELSADALRGVIESFVLREGTDYGERDASMDDKVRDVQRLLERGDAVILFDVETESIHITPRDAVKLR